MTICFGKCVCVVRGRCSGSGRRAGLIAGDVSRKGVIAATDLRGCALDLLRLLQIFQSQLQLFNLLLLVSLTCARTASAAAGSGAASDARSHSRAKAAAAGWQSVPGAPLAAGPATLLRSRLTQIRKRRAPTWRQYAHELGLLHDTVLAQKSVQMNLYLHRQRADPRCAAVVASQCLLTASTTAPASIPTVPFVACGHTKRPALESFREQTESISIEP